MDTIQATLKRLDLADHPEKAREQYELAARTALNLPERHYLESRARRAAR